MSDTSFPSLPPQASASRGLSSAELAVRLIGVSNEIRSVQIQTQAENAANARIQRLEGEVLRLNDDGSVRIQTERGAVDIQPPEGQRLEPGQRVVITIPPNPQAQSATLIIPQQPAPIQTTAPQVQSPSTSTINAPTQTGATTTQTSAGLKTPSSPQTITTSADLTATVPTAATIAARSSTDTITPPAPGQSLEPAVIPQLEIGLRARLVPLNQTQIAQITIPPLTVLPQSLSAQSVLPLAQTQTLQSANEAAIQPRINTPLINNLSTPMVTQPETLSAPRLTPAILTAPGAVPPLETASIARPFLTLTQSIQTQPLPASITAADIEQIKPITSRPSPQLETLSTVFAQPRFTASAPIGSLFIQPESEGAPQTLERFVVPRPLDIAITDLRPPLVSLVPPPPTDSDPSRFPPPPPDSAAPAPAPRTDSLILQSTPQSLSAEIIGRTPEGFPALSIPYIQSAAPTQIFALPADVSDIQVGQQIALRPEGGHTIITPLSPLITAQFITAEPWPLMQDLYHSLSQVSTAQAQTLSSAMPNATSSPAQITAAAMFFISAVRGGDMSGWLGGKNVDILRTSGKTSLLQRLGQEAGLLSRMADAPPGEWRSLSLPFFQQGEITKIVLSYRHDEDQESDDPTRGRATRFVFDLSLSAMGSLQLDGYLQGRMINLILRSEQAFSAPAQIAMRSAFVEALEPTEMIGDLAFSASPDGWVKIAAREDGASIAV